MFDLKNLNDVSMAEQVRALLDERDIRNVIDRYARSASRGDFELFKSCFHDDAVDHHAPSFEGKISEFYEVFERASDSIGEVCQYFMCNLLIELDGDVAHTECQAFSPKVLHEKSYNGDKVMRFSGARYLHRFERRNGVWKIAECWWVPDWGLFQSVPPQLQKIGPTEAPANLKRKPYKTSRDRSDVSYHIKEMGTITGNRDS
jgi:hypothetical protein